MADFKVLPTVNGIPVLTANGAVPLSADWDTGEDRRILSEAMRARDSEGLRLEEAGGALGVFVEHSTGDVGIKANDPTVPLDVAGAVRVRSGGLTVDAGNVVVTNGQVSVASTSTTGSLLSIVRNLTATSTDSPVAFIHQDHASDDRPALHVRQDALGTAVLVTTSEAKASSSIGHGIGIASNDASNALVMTFQINPSSTAELRYTSIHSIEDNVAFRPLVLNPFGNLGVGTSDVEAWHANYNAIQFGGSSAFMSGRATEGFYLMDGAYYDGVWKRRNAIVAPALHVISAGVHGFLVAAIGSADSTFTWTTVMRINNDGNVGIGTISPASKLDVVGHIRSTTYAAPASGAGLEFAYDIPTARGYFFAYDRTASTYKPMDIEASEIRLNPSSGGRVGVGVVTPGGRLDVVQGSTTAAIPALRLEQADLSEEMIRFVTTVGAGNPVDTAALGAYYGKVRVYIQGVGAKWLALYS